MRFRTTLIVIMIIMVFITAASSSVTSEEVLAGWKQNYASLDSMEIALTERYVKAHSDRDPNFAKKFPSSLKQNWIQKANKFNSSLLVYKEAVEEPITITKASYDGIEQRVYRQREKKGIIIPGKPKGRGGPGHEVTSFSNYILVGAWDTLSPIEKMFNRAKQDPNYHLSTLDANTINGVACEGFRLSRIGETVAVSELWVAVDKGMLPIRYSKFDLQGNVTELIEALEVADSNGFWYPKRAQKGVKSGGIEIKCEMVVNKFVLYPVVDPNIFKLDFPMGTTVLDTGIKERYKIGLE
jgi:hypothetical protein